MLALLRRSARLLAVASVLIATGGCASTVIDPSVTTEPPATTTTLPSGSATQLLPRLVSEAGKLSDAIGNNDHKGEQMAIVDNLWNAARPEVAANDGVLALDIDGAIELCHNGERFNRPADADKCFRNLSALIDSYLDPVASPTTS